MPVRHLKHASPTQAVFRILTKDGRYAAGTAVHDGPMGGMGRNAGNSGQAPKAEKWVDEPEDGHIIVKLQFAMGVGRLLD